MNNFVSLFVAMLEHFKLVTEDEAKKLVKDLHSSTLPGTYEEASRLVKRLYDKYEVSSVHTHIEAGAQDVKNYVDQEIAKVREELSKPKAAPKPTSTKTVDTK